MSKCIGIFGQVRGQASAKLSLTEDFSNFSDDYTASVRMVDGFINSGRNPMMGESDVLFSTWGLDVNR